MENPSAAKLSDIEFRTLDYSDDAETRAYLRLLWDIPLEQNAYFTRRSEAFLEEWMQSARTTEDTSNTYSGIALHRAEIVGVHVVRRYVEYEQVGAHIAGLWVHPSYRRQGIAGVLKENGEAWARSIGAVFLNTNVHAENERMLAMNVRAGFAVFRYNLRKRL
jgi:GNAT superfamily N-acetyltransferase